MEEKKIIVFDFDGVVCDSTNECMITSWNTWQFLHSTNNYREKVRDFSVVEQKDFRKVRPYVRGAGEYYILHRAKQENITITDQILFDHYSKLWSHSTESYKKAFLNFRKEFRKKNLIKWIDLHLVFNEIIIILKKLVDRDLLFIATLKDKESVQLILNYHGINLPASKILDQKSIKTKNEALDKICSLTNTAKNQLIFFDDNLTHLIEPHNSGYEVYLTDWGSILPEFKTSAIELGLPLAKISELNKIIF